MMMKIKKLKVKVGNSEILKGVDLKVNSGEVHVVMGPNGSGKSTLAQVIAGNPLYTIDSGQMTFKQKDIRKLSADKRARLGIFLGFQNPVEIPGVSVFNVLRKAGMNNESRIKNQGNNKNSKKHNSKFIIHNSETVSVIRQKLLEYASSLKLSPDHISRSFNEGFSGGEKKRNEILQMMALKPRLVILDEIDSGLDVDGLKLVADAVKKFRHDDPVSSLILITHYARILKYIKADFVHVMMDGRIVKSGKQKLAKEIEEKGYESLNQNSKVKSQNAK